MPIVPSQYGRQEMHPIVLLRETPVARLIGSPKDLPIPAARGVEMARFGQRMIIVNHRSSPVDISGIQCDSQIAQVTTAAGFLAAHSATCLTLA